MKLGYLPAEIFNVASNFIPVSGHRFDLLYKQAGNVILVLFDGRFNILIQSCTFLRIFIFILLKLVPGHYQFSQTSLFLSELLFHVPEVLLEKKSLVFQLVHNAVNICLA